MGRLNWGFAILLAFAIGCGGGQKAADEPDNGGGWLEDSEPEYEQADDTLVPPEKFDEINETLTKRGPHVSRCFGKALETGALPKSTKGTIIIGLTITPAGKPTDVKVLPASSIKEQGFATCVIGEVKDGRFPTLPKSVETSYTYKLERDY
jgi:hypothetical protein